MKEELKTTKVKSKKPIKPEIKTWKEMTPEERKRFEAERSKIETNIRRSMHGLPTKKEWMEKHKPKVEVLKVRVGGCSKRRFHKVCKHTYYVPLNDSEKNNRYYNPNPRIGYIESEVVRRPPAVKKVVEYSCELCNCAITKSKAEPEVLNFVPGDSCFY